MESIQVVKVEPNDIIFCRVPVANLPKSIADKFIEEAKQKLEKVFIENRILVVPQGIDLTVIKT